MQSGAIDRNASNHRSSMPTLSVDSGICVYPLSGSHIFCLMLESKLAQAALELSARPTAVRDFARELVL